MSDPVIATRRPLAGCARARHQRRMVAVHARRRLRAARAMRLSDGWTTVTTEEWSAPAYWREIDGAWYARTLSGPAAGRRSRTSPLPRQLLRGRRLRCGGRANACRVKPNGRQRHVAGDSADALGVVWQWTRSGYYSYPGYMAPPGAIGEYNGKFMVNRLVLRGSSHATPDGHSSRVSQFLPATRTLAVYRPAPRRTHPRKRKLESLRDEYFVRRPAALTPRERQSTFAADVIDGLSQTPKKLLPKYLHDATGSQLFEEITRPAGILSGHARELGICSVIRRAVANLMPRGAALIEFGAASLKAKIFCWSEPRRSRPTSPSTSARSFGGRSESKLERDIRASALIRSQPTLRSLSARPKSGTL